MPPSGPMPKIQCPYCPRQLAAGNMDRHAASAHAAEYGSYNGLFPCRHCGEEHSRLHLAITCIPRRCTSIRRIAARPSRAVSAPPRRTDGACDNPSVSPPHTGDATDFAFEGLPEDYGSAPTSGVPTSRPPSTEREVPATWVLAMMEQADAVPAPVLPPPPGDARGVKRARQTPSPVLTTQDSPCGEVPNWAPDGDASTDTAPSTYASDPLGTPPPTPRVEPLASFARGLLPGLLQQVQALVRMADMPELAPLSQQVQGALGALGGQ